MSNIITLPMTSIGPQQADRLCADLVDANARGSTFGSRARHIQANGAALLQLSSELKHCLAGLDQALKALGLANINIAPNIENIINVSMELSTWARSYDPKLDG